MAIFVSEELSKYVPDSDYKVVVAAGFHDAEIVISSSGRDVFHLTSDHKEADTRIILHAADAFAMGYRRTVVNCCDTHVLILLTAYADQLNPQIWMNAGTAKKPRLIKCHDIQLTQDLLNGILAYHAIKGCDSTSQFSGIGKKTF